jgi:FkbM family methyltransferase
MTILRNIKTPAYFWRIIYQPDKVKLYGVTLLVNDKVISKWIRNAIYKGFYEGAEAKLIKKYLSDNDRVLEIGGGIGLIGSLCKKAASLVIYEANPLLIPIIQNNLTLNGVQADLIQSAITKDVEEGKATFYIGDDFWNASLTPVVGYEAIQVPKKNLEEALLENATSFLIMAVEGYEHALLYGFVIPENIKKIMIEIHPKRLSEEQLVEINLSLTNNGFEQVSVERDSSMWIRLMEGAT